MDMTHAEFAEQVSGLNAFLQSQPWFDFDVGDFSPNEVTITGGLSTHGDWEPDVVIRFEGIFYVSLLMVWKTETSYPVVVLLDGEKARLVNIALQVEAGHNLVRFQPEGYEGSGFGCLVIARSMTWHARSMDGTHPAGSSRGV